MVTKTCYFEGETGQGGGGKYGNEKVFKGPTHFYKKLWDGSI